jgi:hypothetical protein
MHCTEVSRKETSTRHITYYFPVTVSIPPTSHFMLIHFTAIHCPPGSSKTVLVSSSFDFSDPFCPLSHMKRSVTSFFFFFYSSIYPSSLSSGTSSTTSREPLSWPTFQSSQEDTSGRHIAHVDLNQKGNGFGLVRNLFFFIWKMIIHPQTVAEDGLPPPLSPHERDSRPMTLITTRSLGHIWLVALHR